MVVRVRPPLPREMNGFRPFQNAVLVGPGQPAQMVTLSENLAALSNNGVENGVVRYWPEEQPVCSDVQNESML